MQQSDETLQQSSDHAVDPTTTATNHHAIVLMSWWATALGALALGGLYAALPESLTLGPSWLPLAAIVILLAIVTLPAVIRRPLPTPVIRGLVFTLLGVVTLALTIGVVFMVITLPTKKEGSLLLREAVLLWVANILVFALWYWEIDGGGPHQRHAAGHTAADFLFPQQQMAQQLSSTQTPGNTPGTWAPLLFDYLFVAFTGATALSPADTFPLTRKAKMLMVIEAVISLTIVILLAARAVNILS